MTEVEKEQKYEFLCNTPYNTTKSRYYLCFAKATLSLGICEYFTWKKKKYRAPDYIKYRTVKIASILAVPLIHTHSYTSSLVNPIIRPK